MLGWFLHIMIDLFTHSYAVYPSPVLFPVLITDFKGIWWGTGWFVIVNYAAIVFVYWRILKGPARERLLETFTFLKARARSAVRLKKRGAGMGEPGA
jgi:hypothetical protein